MSQRPYKRRRLNEIEIKGPETWSCIESITGPSCIPSWRINRDSPDNEFKIHPETYNSERECREGKCLARPSDYVLNRDLFYEMSSFLPAQDLKTLSRHDPLARDMFAESLAIEDMAQKLSDGFFLAVFADRKFSPPPFDEKDPQKTPTARLWESLRRAVLEPENVVEQEAGIRAIELIMDELKDFGPERINVDNSYSTLLKWIRKDPEFLNRVAELSPGNSSFVWFITELDPKFILDMQRYIGPDMNPILRKSTSDLGTSLGSFVFWLKRGKQISKDLIQTIGEAFISAPELESATVANYRARDLSELALYVIEANYPASTLNAVLDLVSRDLFSNSIQDHTAFASTLVSWLENTDIDQKDIVLKDQIFKALLSLAPFTEAEEWRISDAITENGVEFRESLAQLE